MIALLLAACAPYGPLDAVEVVDTAGVDFLGEIRTELDRFAAWTGRDTACVDRVVVQPVEGADGTYDPTTDTVSISPETRDAESLVRHELCHGLDHAEGLSRSRRDLFGGGGGGRRREAFALACEHGAAYADALLALEEECGATSALGEHLDPEIRAWLDEVVYPAAPFAISPDRVRLPALAVVDLAPLDRDLWWGDGVIATDDSIIRLTQLPTRRLDRHELVLVEHDAADGSLRRTVTIPGSAAERSSWLWLMGSAEVAVVVRNQPVVEAWAVDLATEAVTPLNMADLDEHDMPRGAVVDGRLVYSPGYSAEVRVLDLAGGHREVFHVDTRWIASVQPLDDGVLLTADGGYGPWSPDGTWSATPLPPSPWATGRARALPDGRVLLDLAYMVHVTCSDGDDGCLQGRRAWLVGDERWSLVEPLCEDLGEPLVMGDSLVTLEGYGSAARLVWRALP